MKKILLLLYLLSAGFVNFCFSQTYNNEWINYSQSYYKVYVKENGMHRISYQTLANAGIPLGSIDPRSLQIFNKGEEQYIFVKGENDGVFHPQDYIEFYGKKNDGTADLPLYVQPPAYTDYSLFCDSAAYFITWNSSIHNRRFTIETDVNFNIYTPVPYFYKVSREIYPYQYYAGEILSSGATDPEYTRCEGWFDYVINLGQSSVKNVPTPNRYITGPDAKLEYGVVGASDFAQLNPDHHLKVIYPGGTFDTLYNGFNVLKNTRSIPMNMIGASTTNITFSVINDLGAGTDRCAIAYVQIKYTHAPTLGGNVVYNIVVPDAIQNKANYSISNIGITSGDTVKLIDLSNHKMIPVVKDGSNFKCLIPNSGGEKECWFYSVNNEIQVSQLYKVSSNAHFTDYKSAANAVNADYYIITHPLLWTEGLNYQSFRNASGHQTVLADVNQIYDQYGYGILKSSLAIRNFLKDAYNNFNQKPEFVLLLGKGYRAAAAGGDPTYRNNPMYNDLTLVPTFGYPPADNLFVKDLGGSGSGFKVAIGRLSARNPNQVAIYLDKISLYEQQQLHPQPWMKTILHFGGGADINQQNQFAGYLNSYKNIIQDTLFGGEVRTFLKTSSAPIQINQSDSLKTLINNGVSMMTFFGHAAGIGFDQSIDNPSEYNNYGKYPFLLANSCYVGDIYQYYATSSEEFTFIENKGTIGYLAGVSSGYPGTLNLYSNELYKNISYKNYNKPIGKIINATINASNLNDFYIKETCLTLTLHGDPALKINSIAKPDYKIDAGDIYFTPPVVTSDLDSFNIAIIPTNLGKAIVDSMMVRVVRTYPDGSITASYLSLIKTPLFKDTVLIKIPVDAPAGTGLNKFSVSLDYYNQIDEFSEINNSCEATLFIQSSDVVPVFPYKYAVVPSLPLQLKGSTVSPFVASQTYEFQLDTTDSFNSPVKQTGHVVSSGGVVSWTPVFPINSDSIVYYWRISIDSSQNHNYNWRESSFQLIQGQNGWGQAHFYQFKNDDYQFVNPIRPYKRFEFVNNVKTVWCRTGITPYFSWQDEWYRINNTLMTIWSQTLSFGGNGMMVAVFDSISTEPWEKAINGIIDRKFEFSTQDEAGKLALQHFLDSIPQNDKVLVYSHRNHYAQNYSNNLYQQFESLGSGNIRTIQNNTPYILFGKKGASIGTAHEESGLAISSVINLVDTMSTHWTDGYILSELIGPASEWSSLHWYQKSLESPNTDDIKLFVLGIRSNGIIDTLIRNLPPDSADIYNLSARIDAQTHPYLKLLAKAKDETWHTPAQLKRWQVLYNPAPETALDPAVHLYFYNDSLQEGENVILSIAAHNIGSVPMDSLLIKYWIKDANQHIHSQVYHRKRPHPQNDILLDTVQISTKGLSGNNSLWVELNPDNDQMEQYHFNNTASKDFYIADDKINPLLDITFDGIHILNGDIVSSQPEIQVRLKDENKFLALNDTGSFRVYLIKPGSTDQSRVYFGTAQQYMQFFSADLPNNSCKIIYKGNFTVDGTYTLIVEAKDVSNNESGDNDYRINFEVVNQSAITRVMNWPNPFSTATHFVFTLTGSEIPTYFKIQIMTITGKVVKEIDLSELGEIHIGRNITTYAWNGTDEFGDRLANGVYLYRVITKINGETIENRQSGADNYFNHEFGKMVLIGN
jgi:hypothetical protein